MSNFETMCRYVLPNLDLYTVRSSWQPFKSCVSRSNATWHIVCTKIVTAFGQDRCDFLPQPVIYVRWQNLNGSRYSKFKLPKRPRKCWLGQWGLDCRLYWGGHLFTRPIFHKNWKRSILFWSPKRQLNKEFQQTVEKFSGYHLNIKFFFDPWFTKTYSQRLEKNRAQYRGYDDFATFCFSGQPSGFDH